MGICASMGKQTHPVNNFTKIDNLDDSEMYPYLSSIFTCIVDTSIPKKKISSSTPRSVGAVDDTLTTNPQYNEENPIAYEDPDLLWYIGFIPKQEKILFVVGKLSQSESWFQLPISWKDCSRNAISIFEKSNAMQKNKSSPSSSPNQTPQQTWEIFQFELEKCFWRGDIEFSSKLKTLTTRFTDINVAIEWNNFKPVVGHKSRSELFQHLMVSYKNVWGSKIAMDRKNAVNSLFVEEGMSNVTQRGILTSPHGSQCVSKSIEKKSFLTVKGSSYETNEESDSDSGGGDIIVAGTSTLSSLHANLLSKKFENSSFSTKADDDSASRPSSADSAQVFSSNLPINRVIKYLTQIRIHSSPSAREKIDYILNVIMHDALFEVDVVELAKEEQDEETRTWIKSEFILENTFKDHPISKFKACVIMVMFAQSLQSSSRAMRQSNPNVVVELPQDIENVLVHLDSVLDFNIFELDKVSNHRPLYFIGLALFRRYKLFSRFDISVPQMKHFLVALENGYLNNPYHNALHAADVSQTLHALIQTGSISSRLTDLDILSAILAALIHDFKHSGRTNAFEMKTSTERALLYNDQSILEMYHLTEAFKILSQNKCNILKNLQPHEFRYVRNMVVSLVLGTDITHHFTIISQVQSTIVKKFDKSKNEDVTLLLRLLLKCADVSNPAKRRPLVEKWADRIMEEFYLQGDEERNLGFQISPFMDREKPAKEKCQCGFISYICKPLYDCLQKLDRSCAIYYSQLHNNEREWQQAVKASELMKESEIESNYKVTHNIKKEEFHTEDEDKDAASTDSKHSTAVSDRTPIILELKPEAKGKNTSASNQEVKVKSHDRTGTTMKTNAPSSGNNLERNVKKTMGAKRSNHDAQSRKSLVKSPLPLRSPTRVHPERTHASHTSKHTSKPAQDLIKSQNR